MIIIGRIISKVKERGEPLGVRGLCWEWTGALRNGYGAIKVGDKVRSTHRTMYEWYFNTEIGDLDSDHLCRNKICCNPLHIEPVTRRTNILRSPIWSSSRKFEICKKGHELLEDNVYTASNGDRRCRLCRRNWQREYKRKYRKKIRSCSSTVQNANLIH